jgi:flagella basal body P-ring formation protein FlgA
VRKAISAGLTLLALTTVPAMAQRFEDLNGLDALVVARLGAGVGQSGGPAAPIDRRLKLAACPDTPTIEGPVMGAAVVRCDAIGWRIRVPLRAGSTPAAAQGAAILVKKGDPVQLIAGGASFSVSTMMIADEDGARGDMIRVRADRRSDPVLARVVEMDVVSVPGFN